MGELSRPVTRLVGRDREVDELTGLVGVQRIVTVLGPGGGGKTRLAIAVAQRWPPRTTASASRPDDVPYRSSGSPLRSTGSPEASPWFAVDLSAATNPE